MEKIFVIKSLAEKLWKTEDSITQSMADASALLAGMMQGRQDLKLSAMVTAKASDKIAQAIAQLAQAQSTIIEAHAEMEEVKLRLGVRTKMSGFWSKPSGGGGGITTDYAEERDVG